MPPKKSPQPAMAEPTPHHVSIPRKPRQWPAFLAIVQYATIAAARNKATLAFGFIFPLVFITVFGLLGNTTVSINLGVIEGSQSNPVVQAVKKISVFKIKTGSEAELKHQLEIGKLDALLETESAGVSTVGLPKTNLTLLTSTANPQTAGEATSLINGVVNQANLQLAQVTDPAISLTQGTVNGKEFRYIDFALPGQIGFALLGTALFGTVFGLIALKKTLVLKRLFATPTKPLTFLAGQGASRLLFALAQTVVILAVGVVAFHFTLPHGWLTIVDILLISIVGLTTFLGFGYFMAGFANDENSAGPMVNLVTLPQFLLSGVFFPTDSFPSWLQPIANNLPLSYFNLAIRKVTTESGNLVDTWPYLVGLAVWAAVMYFLASRTFRWE